MEGKSVEAEGGTGCAVKEPGGDLGDLCSAVRRDRGTVHEDGGCLPLVPLFPTPCLLPAEGETLAEDSRGDSEVEIAVRGSEEGGPDDR